MKKMSDEDFEKDFSKQITLDKNILCGFDNNDTRINFYKLLKE